MTLQTYFDINEKLNTIIAPLSKIEKHWLLLMLMDDATTDELIFAYSSRIYHRKNNDACFNTYRDTIIAAKQEYENAV